MAPERGTYLKKIGAHVPLLLVVLLVLLVVLLAGAPEAVEASPSDASPSTSNVASTSQTSASSASEDPSVPSATSVAGADSAANNANSASTDSSSSENASSENANAADSSADDTNAASASSTDAGADEAKAADASADNANVASASSGAASATSASSASANTSSTANPAVASAVPAPRKETPEYQTVEDLAGKRIGIMRGSVYGTIVSERVRDVDSHGLYVFNTVAEGVQALKARRIDAFIEGKSVCELAVSMNSGIGLLPQTIAPDEIGMCLAKGSPLTQKFDELITRYKNDGTLSKLREKWMGSDLGKRSLPKQDWPAPNGDLHAVCSEYDPMSYVGSSGEIMGYEVEILYNIARELGYTVYIDDAPFSTLIKTVEDGGADVALGNITITEERGRKVDMTVPDYDGGVVAIVRSAPEASVDGFLAGLSDSFNKSFIQDDRWKVLLNGLGVTVLISVCSGVLGLLLGCFVVLQLRNGARWAKLFMRVYLRLFNGIPVVVVLLVLYYVALGSFEVHAEILAVLGFSLSYGARTGAVMWAAVEGVPKEQVETAIAMGYTENEVFARVVLPSAMQTFLPQVAGLFVNLVKETSVVGYIAVQDLTRASDFIRTRTMDAFFPLVFTAVFYLVMCHILLWVLDKIISRVLVDTRPRRIKGVV